MERANKKATKLAIVREAIAIQGYIPVPGPRGTTYRVSAITGTATNGAWITNHPTADLMGFIRIKRSAKGWIAGIAERIIARRDEIVAAREDNFRSAVGSDR